MKRFRESRQRFAALHAFWAVLRGGSVACRIDFTDRNWQPTGNVLYIADCKIKGEPLTAWDIMYAEPAEQPR